MAADSPLRRRGESARRRAAPLRPLRRKPKELDTAPQLFEPSRSGPGFAASGERRRDRPVAGRPGSTAAGLTDEDGMLLAPAAAARVDPEALLRARQIAARLAVPRPRRDVTSRRGSGELASVRYRGGSDDIDLDATLEQLTEHPIPEDEDIIVRDRVRTRRSVVLLADVSGSMRGDRVTTVAATVGALAAELARDDLAVLAFWSDAAVLCHLGQPEAPQRLLDQMVRIPALGLTNIAFPLQAAARELGHVPALDARVLLLSDCVHNAGPDPRPIAARLARLDVLLDVSGEHDTDLARDLARLGRGRLRAVRTYHDVAPALGAIFAH